MGRATILKTTRMLGVLAAIVLATTACDGSSSNNSTKVLSFVTPLTDELGATSTIEFELMVPGGVSEADVQLSLDGVAVDSSGFTFESSILSGAITNVEVGSHKLGAEVPGSSKVTPAETIFEVISLNFTEGCEILNDVECMLPFPSSHFLAQGDTPSGWQLTLPGAGMPVADGKALSPEPYGVLDGFSPGTQVLMHFPGGVDLEASNAPRLRPEVRAVDERSLEGDSPTLLIDADTGEQILHFVENDAHASNDSDRQVLFMRPARALLPGHRYIVAVRRLLHADGSAITAEPVFAALRDDRPSSIDAVESRRSQLEPIFDTLDSAGIARSELILAFDFIVGSDENLARDLLSMRDQSFTFLEDKELAGEQSFTVDVVEEFSCEDGGIWRDIQGTFEVPLFLDSDPVLANRAVGFMQYGDDGLPTYTGVMGARYTVLIPCAALTAEEGVKPLLYAHGSFSDYREVSRVADIWRQNADVDPGLTPPAYVLASTDGYGVSDLDLEGGLESFQVGGIFLNLDNVKATPDRQRQGIVNVLSLGRMMKRGMFNVHAAFHIPDGTPAFPGPSEELYMMGISMGGYYGMVLGAFAGDFERISAVVPAANFSHQFQRDVGFDSFNPLLAFIFGPDSMTHALVISLVSELWALGDPAAFSDHVTRDPLPGSVPKKIMMSVALDDGWSPNFFSEVAARSFGIPSLVGSAQPGLVGMDDVAGPLESAYVVYGTGINPQNPEHSPFLTPLANLSAGERVCEPHGLILTPAYFRQLVNFLRPGGEIINTCTGICDAQDPLETPVAVGACDPLAQ